MVKGMAQDRRPGVTTTESIKRNNGFRCMTCGQYTPVAMSDSYGRPQCETCSGKKGFIRVLSDVPDPEKAQRQ